MLSLKVKGLPLSAKGVHFLTDNEIIALYFERSETAITETAEKYGAYCRVIAENILQNSEDCEEVLNSVWLSLWNSVPPEKPENLRVFLAKITRNIALNRLKERLAAKRFFGKPETPFDELSECLPSGEDVEEIVAAKELGESINRFAEKLPLRERNIFIRRYFFGESLAVIGEKYGISQNSAAVILCRTRKKLKKHLKKEDWL